MYSLQGQRKSNDAGPSHCNLVDGDGEVSPSVIQAMFTGGSHVQPLSAIYGGGPGIVQYVATCPDEHKSSSQTLNRVAGRGETMPKPVVGSHGQCSSIIISDVPDLPIVVDFVVPPSCSEQHLA